MKQKKVKRVKAKWRVITMQELMNMILAQKPPKTP